MYQPKWVNGKTVGKSRRDAEGRYKAIVDDLDRLGVQWGQVLDFGAHTGYFSHRLADERGMVVTAVDDTPGLKGNEDVLVIPERLTPDQLGALGYFDIGLCLSVLHHLPDWWDYLRVLVHQCTLLYVETANPNETLPRAVAHDDSTAIEEEMIELGGTVLTRTPGHDARWERPLWVLRS